MNQKENPLIQIVVVALLRALLTTCESSNNADAGFLEVFGGLLVFRWDWYESGMGIVVFGFFEVVSDILDDFYFKYNQKYELEDQL